MKTRINAVKNILKLSIVAIAAFSCNKQVNNTNDGPVVLQPAGSAGTNVSVYFEYAYTEVETTFVDEVAIDSLNFNGDSILNINNSGFESATAANTLLKFNNLPANDGKTIKSAVLYLYGINKPSIVAGTPANFGYGDIFRPNNIGPINLRLQMITGSWDASNVTWHTQPSSADNDGVSIQLTDTTWNNDATTDITDMVKLWVSDPAKNFGCRLRFVSPGGDMVPFIFHCNVQQAQFYSSYATNPAVRPKLVITYE